jgi:hypothetical protein
MMHLSRLDEDVLALHVLTCEVDVGIAQEDIFLAQGYFDCFNIPAGFYDISHPAVVQIKFETRVVELLVNNQISKNGLTCIPWLLDF